MNIEEIKKIPLIDFLASLGYYPEKITAGEHWYKSPYRQENTASFSVNVQKNVWIDFGTGEGGGIFQLAEKIFNEKNVARLIQLIEKSNPSDFTRQKILAPENVRKENPVIIEKVQDITHPILTQYFQKRGIDISVASEYCKEIHYKVGDRSYYSIGFQNNGGGWELRNPNMKSGIAPKDSTLFKNNTDQLTIFEGFFDFLSFKQLQRSENLNPKSEILDSLLKERSDYLILNSTAFLKKSLPFIKQYNKANLFLDNDMTGLSAASTIEATVKKTINFSVLYPEFKDLNAWLITNLENEITQPHKTWHKEYLDEEANKEKVQRKRDSRLSL